MARVVAFARIARGPWDHRRLDALRRLIVCGCALALIAADRALPF
jgi:hypothetical protein